MLLHSGFATPGGPTKGSDSTSRQTGHALKTFKTFKTFINVNVSFI